jgi:hypothetical protein
MAAPYNPPQKNEDFKIRIALESMSVPGSFQVNPTIAAGDFTVDIDGAGFNNFATLPSVSPTGSEMVLLELSAAEFNGDVITLRAKDQTNPKEWADWIVSIPTT